MDWLSCLMLPLALLDPIRFGPLRDELAAKKEGKAKIQENLQDDYQSRNRSAISQPRRAKVEAHAAYLHNSGALVANDDGIPMNMSFTEEDYLDMYGSYDAELRNTVIVYGLLAMLDLLVLPLFLPLVLTQYRWIPLYKKHLRGADGLTSTVLLKTVEQTACLFLDLVFLLPITILLFVTRVRWRPLRDYFREVNFVMSLPLTLIVHAEAWSCLLMLIGDIICLPGFLLLQITQYRAGLLNYLFSHPYAFHTSAYFACLMFNVVIVLIDMVIIWPLALCALVLSLGVRAEVLSMIFNFQVAINLPTYCEGSSLFRWLGDAHPDLVTHAVAQRTVTSIEATAEMAIVGKPQSDDSIDYRSLSPVTEATETGKSNLDETTSPVSIEEGSVDSSAQGRRLLGGDEQLNIFWSSGCVPHHEVGSVRSYGEWFESKPQVQVFRDFFSKFEYVSRGWVLAQFVLSIFDILTSCFALVVMGTVWRAPKLVRWLQKFLHKARIHYNTPHMLEVIAAELQNPNQYYFPGTASGFSYLNDALDHFET